MIEDRTVAEPAFEIDFDHTDAEQGAHIYELLTEARASCPVLHGTNHGGFWALTRYDDVVKAAHDHRHFTTRQGVTIPAFGLPVASVPLTADPPEHAGYRRALQPFFTPAAIAALEPQIRQVVVDHIEVFAARGHADLVRELANPVPPIVIAMILGVDPTRWEDFKGWVDEMGAASRRGDVEERERYSQMLYRFLVAEVEDRKVAPRDDLLTAITQTVIDGEPIEDVIRYGMAQIILVAGHDTTVSGIANALHHLVDRPELRDRATEDPALVERIVEESLRFEAPVFGLARTVVEPTTVADVELDAGDKVLLLFGSANRDGCRFADPDEFDIDRERPGSHVAFGHGRHRCLGEHLARLEMRIAVEEVLRRIPGYRLAAGAEVDMHHALVRGPISLEVEWDPSRPAR